MKNFKQLDIFDDMPNGKQLRDIGIKKAIDNADLHVNNWSTDAYNFLLKYIRLNKEFMTEDVRNASLGELEEPPSNRAWGGVIVRAKKNKLIERIGYKPVTNPKARCTPATLWKVII